jgi:hypothetical protein
MAAINSSTILLLFKIKIFALKTRQKNFVFQGFLKVIEKINVAFKT